MSKTNHRRGYVAPTFRNGQKAHGYNTFAGQHKTMDGQSVNAYSTVSAGNSRSVARDKAGAKKFINSRGRFHDRMACDKIVREGVVSDRLGL